MTTLWTYDGFTQRQGLGSLWFRPWARPEAYVRYGFLRSPKPAQPPLCSTLPWFRLSTECAGPEEGTAVLGTCTVAVCTAGMPLPLLFLMRC